MSTATDEFWKEDAHRIAQLEQERNTGIRMPQKAAERTEPVVIYRRSASKDWPLGLIFSGFTVITVIAAVGWFIYSRPVVTREEFDLLQSGMSLQECESIVGAKSSDVILFEMPAPKGRVMNISSVAWQNNDGSGAAVSFVDGRLAVKLFVAFDGVRYPVVW